MKPSWADMMDEVAPVAPVAVVVVPRKKAPPKGWTVVEPKGRKPRAAAVAPLEMVNLAASKFKSGSERDIFNELKKVFPAGLTADQLASRLNTAKMSNLSREEMGDFLYEGKAGVTLWQHVVPIDPKQRPRVWRIRATKDE